MSEPHVTGGVAGLEATWDRLEDLAATERGLAAALAGLADATLADAAHPALLGSLAVSPVSGARAEAALAEAALATRSCAAGYDADAEALERVLLLLRTADAGARLLQESLLARLGWCVVPAAGALGVATALGDPDALTRHPGLVQDAFATAPGPLGTAAAARALGLAYADPPVTVHRRPDLEREGSRDAGDLRDVVARLGELSALSDPAHPENDGTLEVQTFTATDGTVRHVAYLPGTDDMTTLPWTADADVRDMGTNLRLVGGLPNGYADGVVQALRQAGVRPGEPVLLAGHSQGGLVAAQLVAHAEETGLALDRAVTLGAPVAGTDVPPGSLVLSLENAGDVVPQTDGGANPAGPGHVTVVADGGGAGVTGHHGFEAYGRVAGAADASTHPSVTQALTQLREAGFLTGTAATRTRVLQVERR
ncbi:DUF3089 domain-containing protein [Nocardioides bruguierae]|uniref:DUF3089 domain-containing protein n=1 Tax=Nocardioides bruguierae TaxID=2945102 RepID=UPI0020207CEC|nr:DUF3089 domain-containing protein [Nocardioides bruguierae]MCL8025513.1 DUF3089 domain-containing protein [Nocardioides bruguierae]MCL8027400.1 DUF3089 domain-containing protein [Nocardioides bruguierae]